MSQSADRSLVYRSVWGYRAAMVALYGADYWRRTDRVAALLGSGCRSVVVLCFGDTRRARACGRAGIAWTGVDLRADAHAMIMAALYHFHDRLSVMLDRVLAQAGSGLLARAAQHSSNPGDGDARFRYDAASLELALMQQAERLSLRLLTIPQRRNSLVELHA
jgi:hypothetical protein